MLSFLEPSLADLLQASLRDLIVDVIPRAAAVGFALAIAAVVLVRVRRALGRGRRSRPMPAAV
jgi:hypothetical protein